MCQPSMGGSSHGDREWWCQRLSLCGQRVGSGGLGSSALSAPPGGFSKLGTPHWVVTVLLREIWHRWSRSVCGEGGSVASFLCLLQKEEEDPEGAAEAA